MTQPSHGLESGVNRTRHGVAHRLSLAYPPKASPRCAEQERFMERELSRDPAVRLSVFVDAGLIPQVPTRFQFLQGQLEMAPFVLLPDAGDNDRYAGAPLGHPLLRTPLVLWEVGSDHLRIGHGLHAEAESLYRHLMFVFHEGMPVYDLQLVQTVPGGLAAFRQYAQDIEDGRTPERARQQKRIDLVVPHASRYRQHFLEPGGWIDQAEALQYPGEAEVAAFLRPEFMSLIRFSNYCASTFPRQPLDLPPARLPGHLAELFSRRFRQRAA